MSIKMSNLPKFTFPNGDFNHCGTPVSMGTVRVERRIIGGGFDN